MTAPATRLGASVGELLDQAEETLYQLAKKQPSASSLLAAWPAFSAGGVGLLTAAAGRRHADLDAAARAAVADPLTAAGLHLRATLAATKVSNSKSVPDPDLTSVARFVAAAAEVIQCAHERPGIAHREAAESDAARAAGITRAAEIVRAGVDVTLRAAGRSRRPRPGTAPSRGTLSARAASLFQVRRDAAQVLDAANGSRTTEVNVRGPLDDIRVPTIELLDPNDLLGRFQVAVGDWRRASFEAAARPAISSAELLRATVEARQIIAINAAVTDAAMATGLMTPERGQRTLEHLQRAGVAWSAVTDLWIRFTTGVRPSQEYVDTSLAVQASIRALTRDSSGGWVSPSMLARRVDIAAAAPVARAALSDVVDVARAHEAVMTRLGTTGGLYAPARSVELRPERIEAHIRGRYVPVTLTEITNTRVVYDNAASRTSVARLDAFPTFADKVASTSTRVPATVREARTARGPVSL